MKVQRVVTPTPPSGMPKVELPLAPAPLPVAAPAAPVPAPRVVEAAPMSVAAVSRAGDRKSRPEAPVFSFAPPLPEPPRSRPPPPSDDTGTQRLNGATCTDCGGMNPPNYRFCMTCGATLAAEGAPRAQTTAGGAQDVKPGVIASPEQNMKAPPPPAPSRTPAANLDHAAGRSAAVDLGARMDKTHPPPPTDEARRFAAEQPIVASRVVAIAPGAPQAPAKLVACSRCHGHCVAGTRFCKYCGAPLDDTKVAAEASAPQSVRPPVVPAPERPAAAPPPRRDSPAPFPRPAVEKKAPVTAGPPARARLTVIVEDGSEGRSFPLDDQQVDVGRTEGAVRLEDDPYVSPRHARFLREGNTWIVRDLDSLNGVYARVKKQHPLRDGDLLLLGLEVLQFRTVNDAERGLGAATQHGVSVFGSPAAARSARLMQRTVEGITRDVHHIFRDETIIGREVGDIVFTSDPFLSRRHAAVRRNPTSGAFSLVDLDSSNGTFIAVRGDMMLSAGDYLRIGQHLFRVDFS